MKSLFDYRLVALVVCSALVTACGGGGGGGDSTPPPPAPTTVTVGGSLTGLAAGATVVLQNNGGSNLSLNANGSFTFATSINSGAAYAVTVSTQPSGQSCTVTAGSGTATANVTSVAVACAATAPATVTIGGSLTGLAPSASVVLQNNGGSDLTLTADGNFTFMPAIANGASYAVTVSTQPVGQTCTVANDKGTASANITNVAVTCANNPTFTIGGTVSGLAASTTLVLQNNGGSSLPVVANGDFTFATPVNSGATYTVTVLTQPIAQTCNVTANGTGTANANVTNVTVNCVANTFAVSGTVTGLIGSIVLQNKGANDLPISADGPFNFGAQLPGTTYAVTVLSHPTGPAQNCPVTAGSGTIGSTATNISIVCTSVDQTPPTVTARFPMPTAVGGKVQGVVAFVTFSEAMDKDSINTSSFTVTGPAGPVSGEITFTNGDKEANFTPGSVAVPATLAYDTTYTIKVTTAARDPSHNQLAGDVSWTFNTGKKIAMGFEHTCARLDDGGVKCWGRNDYGQLGYDDTQDRGDLNGPHMNTLARVDLGTGRTAIALVAGDYNTCAILDNEDTKCWGLNTFGQLGQDTTDPTSQKIGDEAGDMANLGPIDFGGGHFALELAGGEDFMCARLDNDTVKCWGLNTSGQLGQDNVAPLGIHAGDIAAAPAIDFGAGLTPRGIALGHYHACALLQDAGAVNHVRCWGDNRWGQLGRGDKGAGTNIGDDTNPMSDLNDINLGTGRTAKQVLANGGHSCALLDNASVKCWGLNTWGQIGLNVAMFANGNQLVCTAGTTCVGDEAGELGDALTPAIAANVAKLTVGTRHNCVLLTGGQLECWGSNEQGQLGLGDNANSKQYIGDEVGEMASIAPTALKAPVVEEADAGGFQTCVWNTDDTLNCWGANNRGQLGHNDITQWGDGPNEMGASLPDTVVGN